MKKQYCVTQLAYINITVDASTEDEAKEIAEETIYGLELKPDFDVNEIALSDNDFYDIQQLDWVS